MDAYENVRSADRVPRWSAATRFAFRIALAYLVLYHVEAYLGLLGPVLRALGSPVGARAMYRIPWDHLAMTIGVHVFRMDPSVLVPVNGSTDSAIHYARTACFLLAAVVSGIVWSVLDRRRGEYVNLYGWLFDFLRYALAIDLLFYGVVKIFPVQMLPVRLFTTGLIQPFGDKSPAGLLWAFVGYSIPYQMLSGAAELVSAILLLGRRTVHLGALVAVATVANVVALNFCYDVDLKLYTSNMLVAAVFLAWPASSSLVRLFVLRQRVDPPAIVRPRFAGWPAKLVLTSFVLLFTIYVYQSVKMAYSEFKLQVGFSAATPLYGIYDVEGFRRNGQDVPPLLSDRQRWRRIVMESPRVVRVQLMDDSFERYRAEYNEPLARLTLFKGGEKSPPSVLVWSWLDADHLELQGDDGAGNIFLSLKRMDRNKFRLIRRGFHWIQRNSLIE
jgi:hypothetical protein